MELVKIGRAGKFRTVALSYGISDNENSLSLVLYGLVFSLNGKILYGELTVAGEINTNGLFALGTVYFKFPSVQFFAHEGMETDADAVNMLNGFYALLPRFADRICIVTAGDVYHVGAARFDILYTSDDTIVCNISNNASVVFKLTLAGKTVMFTADAGVEAGQKLLERYGDSGVLKCDVCQMAHHGQNGCDQAFYAAVRPDVCLWCAPAWLWDNDKGGGFDTHIWKTVKVRRWMEALGVKENYVAKDGTQVLEL